ncbi:MAG TPA: sigma-70 family RNA polymerase sigma factor [Vicinamibacterales bacterium]
MTDDNDDREQNLRALIGAHGQTVRAVLARSERSREDADELWADVFLLAFRRLDELSELSDGQQRGWLIRTASNLAANHGRRRTSWRRMLDRLAREPLEHQPLPEDAVQFAEQRVADDDRSRAVQATLHRLRAADRQVLVLDALGHDGPSIGRQLSISSGAARKRLMVARIAFRQQFGAPSDEPSPAVPPASARARTEP